MRYFIAFFTALGLLILVIVLLLHSGGKPKVHVTPKTLDSYSTTDAEAVVTIDGPVNAAQNHQQVRITVDRDNVTFEQLKGYDGSVTNMQHFANTDNAYAVFLLSLAHAGFTKGDNSSSLSDERGICSLGDRYIFQFRQDGQDIERYWATSCGNPKTYLGALSLTITLFQNQVPNYTTLTQNFSL
jgi:hypothetical protein